MWTHYLSIAVVLLGCSSSPVDNPIDAGVDAGVDAAQCTFDRSAMTCDVSTLSNAELRCGRWVEKNGPSMTCPASFSWATEVGAGCVYEWKNPGGTSELPDVCKLPKNGYPAPWSWLKADCAAGCP